MDVSTKIIKLLTKSPHMSLGEIAENFDSSNLMQIEFEVMRLFALRIVDQVEGKFLLISHVSNWWTCEHCNNETPASIDTCLRCGEI